MLSELEQALPQADVMASLGATDEASMVQALPLVISHMHDYFVHVAARLEHLHQGVSRGAPPPAPCSPLSSPLFF